MKKLILMKLYIISLFFFNKGITFFFFFSIIGDIDTPVANQRPMDTHIDTHTSVCRPHKFSLTSKLAIRVWVHEIGIANYSWCTQTSPTALSRASN